MKLSSLDIRHMEFERSAMGYSRKQVRDFLRRLAAESDELLDELQALRQTVEAHEETIEELRATETELKRTVIAAERIGNEMKEQARREAEFVVRRAKQERIEMLHDAAAQLDVARAELSRLEQAQALVREQLRGQLTAFLAALDAQPVGRRNEVRDDGAEDVIAALKATVAAARREVEAQTLPSGSLDEADGAPDSEPSTA